MRNREEYLKAIKIKRVLQMPSKPSPISLDAFNDLVTRIYDAAMDVTQWQTALKGIVESLHSTSGVLRIQDLQSKEVGSYVTLGIDASFQQAYKDYYVHDDPLVPTLDKIGTGRFMQTARDMPSTFRKSEFYNDYVIPQKMQHSACCLLIKDDSRVAGFGIHRVDGAGYFESHEMELLGLLIPHMQRAIQTNRLLSQLEDKANATSNTLNELSLGIILVDAFGTPLFVNQYAEKLICEGSGLSIKRQTLLASNPTDTLVLQKLIHNASQSTQKTGGAIAINSPGSMRPLSILVTPISNETSLSLGIDSSRATAALFIGIGGKQRNFSLEILSSYYGLTPAEARLASALSNGHSLEEIAEQFCISKNTVRTQLRSCFQKTGVNRQTELVKLILSDPAALVNDISSQI